MTVGTIVCIDPKSFYVILPIWTAMWALIGYWVGTHYRRPKRYLLVQDGGAWTPAKLRNVNARDDTAPIESEETAG